VRTLRPRNPYPRNVNDVCSCEPRRLASWQYTIRVLSGCSASPTSLIRSWSAASTSRAWHSAQADAVPPTLGHRNAGGRELRRGHARPLLPTGGPCGPDACGGCIPGRGSTRWRGVHDADVVYTEGVAGQAYLKRDSEVRPRAEAFSMLQAAALPPADSAELISMIARRTRPGLAARLDDVVGDASAVSTLRARLLLRARGQALTAADCGLCRCPWMRAVGWPARWA
jgi:hypothetical protein